MKAWLLLVVVCAVCAQAAISAVLRVPKPFPTVRAAYEAAQDGDVIEVDNGYSLESPGDFLPPKQILIKPAQGRFVMVATNAPANDRMEDAQPLESSSILVRGENYAATVESSPRDPFIFLRAPSNSVWYAWTALFTSECTVRVDSEEFVPRVDVFVGHPGVLDSVSAAYVNRLPNELSFYAQEGTRYLIAVDTLDGWRGVFHLSLLLHPPPVNDAFADAIPLLGRSVQVVATNFAATAEVGEPSHAGAAASHRSLWWRWTTPVNPLASPRPVRISTAGSDFDTVLAVYTGDSLANLVPVASNDNAPPSSEGVRYSELSFVPVPGQEYSIALDAGSSLGPVPPYGHCVLSIDYAPLELGIESMTTVTNVDRSVSFLGQARVRHRGNAPTGPLRLRTVSQAGTSLYSIRAGLSRTVTSLLTNVIPVLAAGTETIVPLAGVCPPPVDGDDLRLAQIQQVVFLLEELFQEAWWPAAGAVGVIGEKPRRPGYGFVVDPGPLRSVVGTPLGSEFGTLTAFQIQGGTSVTPGYPIAIKAVADFQEASAVTVLPDWTVPAALSLGSDGLLRACAVDQPLQVDLRAVFQFQGEALAFDKSVTIQPAPVSLLLAIQSASARSVNLQLVGNPCRRFRLERSQDLLNNSGWIVVGNQVIGIDGRAEIADTTLDLNTHHVFYRAVELQ